MRVVSKVIVGLCALVGVIVAAPADAAASSCPEARRLRLAGDFARSEQAARMCHRHDPKDVSVWTEMSRVIAYQKRFEEALYWVDRGLERYPHDADLAIWRSRLLGWMGRHEEARAAYDAVVSASPIVLDDPDNAVLGADLYFWAQDWVAAGKAYDALLEVTPDDPEMLRKRGICALEAGDDARALASFDRGCAKGGSTHRSCDFAAEARRKEARWWMRFEPGFFITEARNPEYEMQFEVLGRVWRKLSLGVRAQWQRRDYSKDNTQPNDDVTVAVKGFWQDVDWSLTASAGFGLGTDFLPRLSLWIEPALRIHGPVWGYLRYWRLSFAQTPGSTAAAGAHVLSPAVDWTVGKVRLDLRYYLAIEDAGGATHAGLARVNWDVAPRWGLQFGVGGGNGTDYLQLANSAAESHVLGLAQVIFKPSWQHRVALGYVLRFEQTAGRSLRRHEVRLSYRLGL